MAAGARGRPGLGGGAHLVGGQPKVAAGLPWDPLNVRLRLLLGTLARLAATMQLTLISVRCSVESQMQRRLHNVGAEGCSSSFRHVEAKAEVEFASLLHPRRRNQTRGGGRAETELAWEELTESVAMVDVACCWDFSAGFGASGSGGAHPAS